MKQPPMNLESAEAISFKALAFLAEEPQRLVRFLELTGLSLDELREHAGAPETKLAVLEHLLSDESLLLVFSAHAGVTPDSIGTAQRLISGQPPAGKAQ